VFARERESLILASDSAQLLSRSWTYDQLVAELPETTFPTELLDSKLIMSPSPSFFHQQVVDRFHDQLKAWVRKHHLGKTAVSPIDMVLTQRNAPQPDVVFVAKDRLHIIQETIRGPADLVAEVISEGSRTRDRIEKRDLYEQHGIKEYWMLDTDAQTVEVLFLESGQYRLVGRWHSGEKAESLLLKGFSVTVSELFVAE